MLRKLLLRLQAPGPRGAAARVRRCRPAVELLEGRLAPAVLTVNSPADDTTADNVLTLREAVAVVDGTLGRPLTAAEQAQVSGTLGSGDAIGFDLPGGPHTITLTLGALAITRPVTVTGPGAANMTVNGNGQDRVFAVGQAFTQDLGLNVSLSGLTVTGGVQDFGGGLFNFGKLSLTACVISNNNATASGGGGIYNGGALTLAGCTLSGNSTRGASATAGGGLDNISAGTVMARDCSFTGNTATGSGPAASSGGGAANSGSLTVSGCTFSDNGAASDGGAVFSDGALVVNTTTFHHNSAGADGGAARTEGSSLAVTGCTFDGNTAASEGGALDTTDAQATLTNCTLAGNTAGSLGGAVEAEPTGGPVTLTNVTVTANRVAATPGGPFGGGLSAERPLTLFNTLVAGNFQGATGSAPDDVAGTLDPGSAFNLIGTGGAGGLVNGVNHNQVGVTDPGFGALTDNGGPTQTALPLPGSPAIDAGADSALPPGTVTDQRGFRRVVNGTVDIGAVEIQPPTTTTALTVSSPLTLLGQPVTVTATVAGPTPDSNTPTGTVTFAIDGVPLAAASLVDGVASLTLPPLPLGVHTVTATYSGDVNFTASTAAASETVEGLQDVTGLVSVQLVLPRNRHGRPLMVNPLRQTLRLTNESGAPLTGPVDVLLDGLPGGVVLKNATGVSQAHVKPGDPYLVASWVDLGAGQSVTVTLLFANRRNRRIRFQTFVLTGPGVV